MLYLHVVLISIYMSNSLLDIQYIVITTFILISSYWRKIMVFSTQEMRRKKRDRDERDTERERSAECAKPV